jgi:hypothetical protein
MLLWAIAILVVGAFAAGTIWNVRRGDALVRWMQPGLKRLGAKSTLRWLGSTAIELVFRDGRAPFASASVVVFLAPRDMPWLWAFSMRRDTLILRGELRDPPRVEVEWHDAASWSGRDARAPLHGDCDELLAVAARCGLPVRRLSVRRDGVQLQLHVDAPKGGAEPAPLFDAFQELADRVTHAPAAARAGSASRASAAAPAVPSTAGMP